MPYISLDNIIYHKQYKDTLIKGNTNLTNPFKAHTESYTLDNPWNEYDVLGIKKGTSTFSYNKTETNPSTFKIMTN